MGTVEAIIVSALGSTGLFALVQFLIQRHDTKANLAKQLKKIEKDSVRLQLLFMIKLMPQDTHEIMTLAKYYFHDLKSNWYATPIFYKWLTEYKIAKPEWFVSGNAQEGDNNV